MTLNDQAIAVREETAITRADPEQAAGALAHILATGDLGQLTDEQRVAYYLEQCTSLGLNPISRPFDWIWFKEPGGADKLTLYPNQSAAAQLRRNHQISARITRREIVGELFVCEAEGITPNGRIGQASKYVPLTNKYGKLTGTNLANAFMKAETGVLRRLTLSMVGLASPPDLDELKGARPVIVDGTGKLIEHPTPEQRALAEDPRLARAIGEPTYEDRYSRPATDAERAMLARLEGAESQAPTIEELTPPTRPYRPPTRFHCDVEQWRATWFMVVRDTFLDPDEARHDFIRWYTSGWPETRQTDSLGTFLERATDRQAEALINAARETIAEEAEARANDPEGELDGIDGVSEEMGRQIAAEQRGQDARPAIDKKVHQAAVLTGAAPSKPASKAADEYVRPDPDGSFSRRELVNHYLAATKRRKSVEKGFKPGDIDRMNDDELAAARIRVDDETDAIEDAIAAAAEADEDGDQGEMALAF